MVIEADRAAAIIFTRVVSRATGRSVQGMLAHFIRFRDGKLIEIREFMDSFSAVEQTLGRDLIDGDLSRQRNNEPPPAITADQPYCQSGAVSFIYRSWPFCIHSRSPTSSTRL